MLIALAYSLSPPLVKQGHDNWFFITVDYVSVTTGSWRHCRGGKRRVRQAQFGYLSADD
ncbi:MAG: hypothetical protein H6883_00435 [Rhodobiaceae bacterium]|nr:hypothetical protein [Rhodobiaceae bacterium]